MVVKCCVVKFCVKDGLKKHIGNHHALWKCRAPDEAVQNFFSIEICWPVLDAGNVIESDRVLTQQASGSWRGAQSCYGTQGCWAQT